MAEVTVKEAARRLKISEQRTREMLRDDELHGRRLDGHAWLVDATSVQDRARADAGRGRPWADQTIAAIVSALSNGGRIDSKSALRLRRTDIDHLWRKIAQGVTVRLFDARKMDIVRDHLSLTGESAIDRIGEKLVGESAVLHGYLRDIDVDDLIDGAGLVADGDGNLAIHQLRAGHTGWIGGEYAPRALIAADCARAADTRVRSAGLRALDDMRNEWLMQNT